MREILFRGKRKDNGEWVEGSLIIAKNFCCILQDEEKVHPLDYPYLGNESGCIDGYATPVVPETVGQYTGLTDKNGKKIFEGDIVYYYMSPYHVRFIVEFFDGAFVIKSKGNHIRSPLYHFCPLVEVIGNIYDNPELLEAD